MDSIFRRNSEQIIKYWNKIDGASYRVEGNFLCFECIDGKHCNVGNQQECNDLTSWLGTIMFWEMDATAWHISNEQQLQYNL